MSIHISDQWPIRLCKMGWLSLLVTLLPNGLSGTANAQLVESAIAATDEAIFPNDWYVRDGEGLEDLRNLEGKPAKEISIAEWKGEATSLAQLKGKIVVLDFWATWCGPCMAAIPKNVEFVEKYKDKGVVLLGVHDAKAGWDTVDQVISDKGINYTVGLDASQGETTKSYALKFWPTYVVIDRDGIVRAAGIKPNKIEEAVIMLMAGKSNDTKSSSLNQVATFPEKWFLGGNKRMASSKKLEGKPAPKLSVSQWIGEPIDGDSWSQQVRVVQFVRPELSVSIDQLSKLQSVADRFKSQGVVFVAVCDSRASLERMKAVAEEKRIEIPVGIDRGAEDAIGPGVTSNSMGIKFSPATIVIDRAGVLRGAGLKPDFLDKILNQLLAEAIPIQESKEKVTTTDDVVERPKSEEPTKTPDPSKTQEPVAIPKPTKAIETTNAPEAGEAPGPEKKSEDKEKDTP